MRKLLFALLFIGFIYSIYVYPQENIKRQHNIDDQLYYIPKNHDPNFEAIPGKSLYESKDDWQYIIDTTWGLGDPLSQKLLIFNTFSQKLHDEFDGFLSLNLNWDSLKNYYLDKITESTSKGAFSSIMSHFAYDLVDFHTRAFDNTVNNTPLNPGIPILLLGSYITVEHFGAVTTILPDSTTLVLRVVPNHPLNLEPGDIILGYEGIPWKYLAKELLDAGLPLAAYTGGCESAHTHLSLFGAGINWHLFDTIDILKYSTGDTVHLSVQPLLNLNLSPMVNNEQLSIPNIPFPDIFTNQVVTYGILENTNIGYIYLFRESPTAAADQQFYEAVNALKNTDALIIDMRFNLGGWALFDEAFKILFNDFYQTIEDAYRCNINTFELCRSYNWPDYQINGVPPLFDRPIAVLLGPTCVSMGDATVNRLMYHPMIKFFGKSSNASLGFSHFIQSFPNWSIRYSICDMLHTNNPGDYLNRKEFPIDYPVWHNPDDVAQGKDAVVEKALDWINNVVYPHNILTDKTYYAPVVDTVKLSTIIENPNSNQISARAYIQNLNDVLIDSVDLDKHTFQTFGENWNGRITSPLTEEYFKASVTVFDQTTSTSFTLPNANRFTTAGPAVLDSISWIKTPTNYYVEPFLKNQSNTITITDASVRLICNDAWVTDITPTSRTLPNILPGSIVNPGFPFTVTVNNSLFPGYFNFKVEVMSEGWPYWKDSMRVETTFQLTVSVVNGWNMVSIPGLHPVNQNVLTWWPGKDPLAEVFKYGGIGYNTVTTATPGEGYWMKNLGANIYNTGDEWPTTGIQIVQHNPISANPGWNLIGGYELSVAAAGITTIPPGLQSGPIYKYSGGYQVATTLDPGYGYWIKLTGGGQIIIPETLSKGESKECFPENWGKIILTDATGINYTLYAVNGEIDLKQYELPPAAPNGIFDVRYSSGRIAENLSSDIQIIEMQGIIYPITVKTEGLTITLQDETGELVNSVLAPGKELVINNSSVNKLTILSAELENNIPTVFSLSQNYPNPFNPSTTFRYSIPAKSKVVVKVFDVLGNEIATLMDEEKSVGTYELTWNAADLSSGIYFYQLKAGEFVNTKKMILLK